MALERAPAAAEPAVPVRGKDFRPKAMPLVSVAALGAVLALWAVAAAVQDDFTLLPPPADVLAAFGELWRSGELARHVTASLGRLAAGWSLGAAAGVVVGLAIGLSSVARAALLPLVSALFATPKIALLPLFVVWLGIGETAKVATVAVGVFSPMVLATSGGVDAVDRGMIRMAQSFGLPMHAIVRKVILPGALGPLLTGVRVTASIAIVLLTGAEMIAAQHGLGVLALNSAGLMRTDRLFVAVGLLALLGLGIAGIIGLVERVVLKWR